MADMTREEAIKVLEMFLHKQCDLKRTEFAYDQNTVWEAVNMASEALEQEPKTDVLNKIRAEIADLDDAEYEFEGYYKAVTDALQIIDKYKAESEG